MRVSCPAVVLMALVGGAQAFSTPAFGLKSAQPSVVALQMSEEEAAAVVETVPTASAPVSGLRMKDVRKSIDSLTKENFSESLATIEPFLLHEAGSTAYGKAMRRIQVQAKFLGVEIPADFALDAKATAKKRAKQDEFVQAKIAEAAEAAAEPVADEEVAAESVEEPELVAA